ncbi:hypothetical protein [Cytobacillus oceanisediminis]|nr:hypothetical protein [Cytobacillus oceanisediminis]
MLITAIVVLLLALALVVAILLNQDELADVLYRCIGEVIAVDNGVA